MLLVHLLVPCCGAGAREGPGHCPRAMLGGDVGLTVHAGCWKLQYEEKESQGNAHLIL